MHFCKPKKPTGETTEASPKAHSNYALLFRIKVQSPMEYGADISWLSTVPEENEVLYPPLTYLRPISEQSIRNENGEVVGKVIMVKPSFPS